MESNNFDFTAIYKIVKDNFKLFVIVGVLAIGLSAFFSSTLFLKPRYKSVAVMYPLNINLYSEESQTEQLLQMMEGSSIRDAVIDKFNLYQRYDIEEGAPASKHNMYLNYNERVIQSKTQYESVLLEVFDESPDTARMMADEILNQLTLQIQRFYHKRGEGRARSFKKQMDYQLAVVDSIEQEIVKLSEENHLVQFESQSREIVRGYIDALSRNANSNETDSLRIWLEKLEKSGSIYQSLQNVSEAATEQYGVLTNKYLDWKAMSKQEVHYFDLVVVPEVADKKVWPVRWLIVMLTLVSACFLTLVILAIAKRN